MQPKAMSMMMMMMMIVALTRVRAAYSSSSHDRVLPSASCFAECLLVKLHGSPSMLERMGVSVENIVQ
jgi:hypothetical protein